MKPRFAAAVSEYPTAATAVGEVVGQVLEHVGTEPDLAFCFVGDDHVHSMQAITSAVRQLLAPRTLVACSTTSVVGGPQEIEDRPALSLFAVSHLPAPCAPVRLEVVPGDPADPDGWTVRGLPPDLDRSVARTLVLITDPATFPAEAFVEDLAREWPALSVVGGMAATSPRMGAVSLGLDDALHVGGAVGLLLPPELPVRAAVSQGCRPVGDPFTVTKVRDNIVLELGGQPALARLEQLVERASPDDRALLAGGVHLGVVIDELRDTFTAGDFLVRSVLGAERGTGGIAVAGRSSVRHERGRRSGSTSGPVELGATVQFQVRDASTADDDLRLALAGPPAAAALVFTCVARGMRLFDEPDHDAREVHDAVARGAVSGMFCSGEFGPVGLRSFVHGYTASVLLFEERADARSQLG